MAYLNFSGYQTSATGWIEAILQDSNTIVARPAGYLDTGVDYILFPTDAGVCACSRVVATGVTTKLGWLDQTDITAIATDETYLYVAYNSGPGDIGRIALSDILSDNTDHTADYTAAFGSTNSMFSTAAAKDVIDLCAMEISSTWYLAYIYESENAANSTCEPYYTAIGEVGGTYYRTSDPRSVGAEHISLSNDGTLFVTKGTSIAWKASAHSVAANEWTWDSGAGNHDLTTGAFPAINNAWSKYDEDNCSASSISIAANVLTLSATVNSDSLAGIQHYGGTIEGDFDLIVTGCEGTDPAIVGAGEYFTRKLAVYYDASNLAYVSCKRRWDASAARIETDMLGMCIDSVNASTSDTDDLDATAPQSTWLMRIKRTESHVLIYYDIGAGWVELVDHNAAGWGSHVYISLSLECLNIDTETGTWDIYDVSNDDAQDLYSDFTAGKPITGLDAYKHISTVNTSTAMVCFDDNGAALLSAHTTPASSTVKTFKASGGDYSVLSSDNVTAVMMDRGESKAWLGTSDAGIDVVSTGGTLLGTASTTQGKTIDNQCNFLAYIGSAAYGTGAGATTVGAGYLSGDFYNSITDTDVYAETVKDTLLNYIVMTGCRKPSESDYNYSYLYRRVNGGSWYYVRDNGASAPTWDTSGTKYQFDVSEFEAFLVYQDLDLSDSMYEYKWSHVNDGAIESSGTVTDPVYIDEPVITASSYLDTDNETRARLVQITGDSGDDSGNDSGNVYKIKIEQVGGTLDPVYIYCANMTGPPWIVPVMLEGGDGSKTIRCTPYDKNGQAGSADDVSFAFSSPSSDSISFSSESNMMIAFKFISDESTWVANSTYTTDFPATNVATSIVNEVWRGKSIYTENGTASFQYTIRIDMASATQRDIFFLRNHNFQSEYLSSCEVYLCANASDLGTSAAAWYAGASKKVELTNLTPHDILCHRPEWGYRYWAVLIYATATDLIAAALYRPYIGRIGIVQTSHIWQPQFNPRDGGMKRQHKDESIIAETDDQSFEALSKDQRSKYTLPWRDLVREMDWHTVQNWYEQFGQTGEMLLLVDPDDFKTDETSESAFLYSNTWDPLHCQFEHDIAFTDHVGNRATFTLPLLEIAGKGSGN